MMPSKQTILPCFILWVYRSSAQRPAACMQHATSYLSLPPDFLIYPHPVSVPDLQKFKKKILTCNGTAPHHPSQLLLRFTIHTQVSASGQWSDFPSISLYVCAWKKYACLLKCQMDVKIYTKICACFFEQTICAC